MCGFSCFDFCNFKRGSQDPDAKTGHWFGSGSNRLLHETACHAATSATALGTALTLATHDLPQRTKKSERLVDSAC